MSEVLWRQYKTYSGCLVRGEVPFTDPENPEHHLDRAVWLASQLEAPKWGGVQSYDGAGMSAGLLHNIAVMPKSMEQGSFFPLLRRMKITADGYSGPLNNLLSQIAEVGWTVAADGKLRALKSGAMVSGRDIRNEFSPPGGKVPKRGDDWKKASNWAWLVHEAFSDPETWRGQIDYATEWLASGNRSAEVDVYRRFAKNPKLDSAVALHASLLPPEIDLAMCVYHSFSVNAPTPAAAALRAAASEVDSMRFAAKLIRKLGTSTYGAWHDEPGEGGRSRYDKTRRSVWGATRLWPVTTSRVLMPTDL